MVQHGRTDNFFESNSLTTTKIYNNYRLSNIGSVIDSAGSCVYSNYCIFVYVNYVADTEGMPLCIFVVCFRIFCIQGLEMLFLNGQSCNCPNYIPLFTADATKRTTFLRYISTNGMARTQKNVLTSIVYLQSDAAVFGVIRHQRWALSANKNPLIWYIPDITDS